MSGVDFIFSDRTPVGYKFGPGTDTTVVVVGVVGDDVGGGGAEARLLVRGHRLIPGAETAGPILVGGGGAETGAGAGAGALTVTAGRPLAFGQGGLDAKCAAEAMMRQTVPAP